MRAKSVAARTYAALVMIEENDGFDDDEALLAPNGNDWKIGRLDRVPMRDVWSHEALDFTPWLLRNADVLAEALGMTLSITAAEHPVGRYRLDLLGSDGDGHVVIIENQFGESDHYHLGQLLTYASGTDAANVVWLTEKFNDEHRAALEWLNERTSTATRFFGVEVSAVRIGDSLPAPHFRVVVMPNDWEKAARTTVQAQSTKQVLYKEFWGQFRAALSDAGLDTWTSAKSNAGNWFGLPAGSDGTVYGVGFGFSARIRSELAFDSDKPDINDRRFNLLHGLRDTINGVYGSELAFESQQGRNIKKIVDYADGSIENRDDWPRYIAWFIDAQRRLRKAVETAGGIPA
ncbi:MULTISPECIES: DUF4268 domain-containing protein [Mycobacteriaceae]|uniref:DUF4268 domain-containing protein n=1 Tax=Mycobacteriaceae TaxID=1762 RepID=UPI0013FDDBD4|nr:MULTISPECIES: DUF4268 domain-containing protein [Mycobacteriaceae]MDP7701091.1 DUF4268 domain-containing protein [Mycobacterium sp. TY815]MDP7707522.1 DUF4268 domain-containing protein [Mycobacterium sp. TY815]MDP7707610.1 DUF4268 domain-containing protein [Mycobacterium sp. TY815]